MKLLILGGTIFLGRHLVEAALARNHEITLFNRGQHNPDLFPQVEKLHGNRAQNLSALAGRRWDAVIDTCGYVPRYVRMAAECLVDSVDHYTFVSTVSVYPDFSQPGIDERAPVGVLADESVEEVTGETYGPLKALCEQAAEATMPGRVFNLRPGLIVGPYDASDRFTYWVQRMARGGEVLAPGDPQQPVQFIDVRDLAAWTVQMVEARQTGVYNATGPAQPLPMQQFLETCQAVIPSNTTLTWVSEAFLLEQQVGPFVEMPLWVPASEAGLDQVNCKKAIQAGLRFRPINETIRDTLTWHNSRPQHVALRAGLSPERERALLEAWHRS
ncbi:MAG: SDR family oxidoreductase [Caldilineaceae bacterium]